MYKELTKKTRFSEQTSATVVINKFSMIKLLLVGLSLNRQFVTDLRSLLGPTIPNKVVETFQEKLIFSLSFEK